MSSKLLIIALLLCLSMARRSWCEENCPIGFRPNVELVGPELRLSDVLTSDTCDEVRSAAAQIRLGAAPLEGSPRILERRTLVPFLQRISARRLSALLASGTVQAPERIVVRRGKDRASCSSIAAVIRVKIPSARMAESAKQKTDLDCGAGDIQAARSRPLSSSSGAPQSATRNLLVRPGQPATLLSIQDGIRISVASVSLDSGARGQRVRARIANSGRVVHAFVLGAGLLGADL